MTLKMGLLSGGPVTSYLEVSGAVGNDALEEMTEGLSDNSSITSLSVVEEFEPKLRMVGLILETLLAESVASDVDRFVCDST